MISLSPNISPLARQWRNDPKISDWCRQHTLLSEEDHKRWLYKIEHDNTIKMFGLTLYDKPYDIGVCGFTSINYINRSAEFSLYIAPEYQGNGYALPALKLLLKHGFENFGFNRIWGETFHGNKAIKIFLSAGMKLEGTLRQTYFKKGKFIDSHIYSILAEDYHSGISSINIFDT